MHIDILLLLYHDTVKCDFYRTEVFQNFIGTKYSCRAIKLATIIYNTASVIK